jgi:UPF0716 protein FxsA
VFPILLVLFIAVPVIEIGLFIQIGGFLGLWPTIALVLVSAVVGASLVRSQGIRTLLTVQQRLQQGELPAQQILEGVLLAAAGVLLLTPGFLTDAMGMALLLPLPRAMVARRLMSKISVTNHFQGGFNYQTGPFNQTDHFSQTDRSETQDGQVYEGEFEQKQSENDINHRLK